MNEITESKRHHQKDDPLFQLTKNMKQPTLWERLKLLFVPKQREYSLVFAKEDQEFNEFLYIDYKKMNGTIYLLKTGYKKI